LKPGKLTKLEKFVWSNYAANFQDLATQTNRSLSTIERAYDRARRKVLAVHANTWPANTPKKTQ
jgi:hypothetical protein